MSAARCPLCAGAGVQVRPLEKRGAEQTLLHRCLACGSEFVHPQPSDAWLETVYAGYFDKRASALAHPKRGFFEDQLRRLPVDLAGRRVLEVGAGEGDCAVALLERWPTAALTALEPNPASGLAALEPRLRWERQSLEGWLATAGSHVQFDAVLLFDVLEHLREPVVALADLMRHHVAPGGIVLATFPNVDGWLRRAMGPLWLQYKTEHLVYPSRAGVAALARAAGLETCTLEPLTKRLPVDYFLAVQSHLGPRALQPLARILRRAAPAALARRRVPLRVGEWRWVARRPIAAAP